MTTMPAFAVRKLRTERELADARAALKRNGFTQCDRCTGWHNEDMKADAFGSARDPRCPICGAPPCPPEGD